MAYPSASSTSKNLPLLVKRSVRNYEVVITLLYGKLVTCAVAVIEDGEATYALGKLTYAQVVEHANVFDVAEGCYNREYDRMRTENLLEILAEDGVEIFGGGYKTDALQLKFSSHDQMVETFMLNYLKKYRISVTKHPRPLHIKFLERMRPRNGYLKRRGGLDAS